MSLLSIASRLPAVPASQPSLRRTILEALRTHDNEPSSSFSLDDDPAVYLAPAPLAADAPPCGDQDDKLFHERGWDL